MTDWQSWSVSPVRRERAHLGAASSTCTWRSQGVGYIYVAGGIPQIQMMTHTGAAEQHGHQTALTHLLLSSGASVCQQPPKAELPTMSTPPAESLAARSKAGSPLPTRARVVVIGGGQIGTSVAYHLAQMGCSDVVLLELSLIHISEPTRRTPIS